MRALTQNQTAEPLVFMLVNSGDHISPLTGVAPTVTISKNGAAFAAVAGAVTEIGNGWYKVAGNATDANTLGPLILHATAAGGDPSDHLFQIIAFNPRNSVSLGLTMMPSNMVQLSSDSAAADNLEAMMDGTGGVTVKMETLIINNPTDDALIIIGGENGARIQGNTCGLFVQSFAGIGIDVTAGGGPGCRMVSTEVVGSPGMQLIGSGLAYGLEASFSETYEIANGVANQMTAEHGVGSWVDVAVETITAEEVWSYAERGLTETVTIDGFNVTIVNDIAARILNMTEVVPTLTDYRYTAQALEEAPTGSGAGEAGGDFSESEEDYVLNSLTEIKNIVSATKTLIVSGGVGGGGDINNSNIVVVASGNMDNKYSQPTLVLPEIPANFEEDAGTSRVDFANALFAVLRKATVTGITQTQPAPYDLTSLAAKVDALEEQKVPKMRSVIVTGVSDANVSVGFADMGTTDYIVLTQVLADSGVNIPTVTFSVVNNSQLSNGVTIRCDGAAVGLQILVSIIERVQ
jgi:hypothetical protein